MNTTKRQTLYRLEKLNSLLKSENVPFLVYNTSSTKSIHIPQETKDAIFRMLSSENTTNADYFTREDRLLYIYLLLFINIDYLSLPHFIDALNCSRSTILLDVKELKQSLEEDEIQICNNRKKGYYLVGSEIQIRRIMIQYVMGALTYERGRKILDRFLKDWNINDFDRSRQIIAKLTDYWNIHMIETRMIEFIYIFILIKARIQSGVISDLSLPPLIETDVIPTLKEYSFTVDLLHQYPDTDQFSNADLKYITSWIIGISFGDIRYDTMDLPFISSLVRNIIIRFEIISGTHLKDKDQIFSQLYAHLRPAFYRLIFKLPIFNPAFETVKAEYATLYKLMGETMKPFSIFFNNDIPEDEIAYLTMHFAVATAKSGTTVEPEKKKALIICTNGVASSVILYNELTKLFPEIEFLPPENSSHLTNLSPEIDIIFTTNSTPLPDNLDIPVICMNPVMSAAEKNKISRQVYRWLGDQCRRQPDISIVMDIITKYTDIHDYDTLRSQLLSYFYECSLPSTHPETSLHLTDMIRTEIINLNLDADTREDAIRAAYEPMVKTHCVLQTYVEEAIHSSKDYTVITKHVALPHTRPEAGAITCALGIGVLKEPVVFGNKDNDPVKYVFALSAINNTSHLQAMAELINLLNDSGFYHLLDTATDPEEVMEYIRNII